jgi:protein phosphatase
VCRQFPKHLRSLGKEQPGTQDFQEALEQVSEDMSDYVKGDPAAASMATTFTMVHLGSDKMTIGWCGDSRGYLVRNGNIRYHTFDHSLVGEMVRKGELTWEEARTHPQSNVITKSVNAQSVDQAEFKHFSYGELQENDYVMICTDGVLETFANDVLANLMDGQNTPQRIAAAIDEKCRWYSNDNYSLTLFQLKKANG